MKIDIWSDIMCPFCYIGKRRFENALEKFPHKNEVEVTWHSFQLDPELKTNPGQSINEMLAEKKGWTVDYAKKLNANITEMALQLGLNYDFDNAIPADTFDAHRLTHLAKTKGLQNEMEEKLFSALFVEGKNIGDKETLISLGSDIGLNPQEINQMLESDDYTADVKKDIAEAQAIGVTGVPFFVLDRKYAVSGAQASEAFLQALQQAWEERNSPGNS